MTQESYQKAIKFAGEKHKNQKVTGTESNYLLHISNVAMEILVAFNINNNFDVDFAIQLALLHDTIEDTETTFDEIKNEFGIKVALGVQALTKDNNILKGKRMIDSLNRINQLEKEVGIVKLADRITNLQKPPKIWNEEKINKYFKEAQIINKTLNKKNIFLNNRLSEKILEYQKYIK